MAMALSFVFPLAQDHDPVVTFIAVFLQSPLSGLWAFWETDCFHHIYPQRTPLLSSPGPGTEVMINYYSVWKGLNLITSNTCIENRARHKYLGLTVYYLSLWGVSFHNLALDSRTPVSSSHQITHHMWWHLGVQLSWRTNSAAWFRCLQTSGFWRHFGWLGCSLEKEPSWGSVCWNSAKIASVTFGTNALGYELRNYAQMSWFSWWDCPNGSEICFQLASSDVSLFVTSAEVYFCACSIFFKKMGINYCTHSGKSKITLTAISLTMKDI